jgi:hypothetical protein
MTTTEPERRLMLAVLDHAIEELGQRTFDPRGRRRFAETADWFAADTLDHPFSFASICLTLGLDASYLRARLRRTFGPASVRRMPPRTEGRPQPLRARRLDFDVAPGVSAPR